MSRAVAYYLGTFRVSRPIEHPTGCIVHAGVRVDNRTQQPFETHERAGIGSVPTIRQIGSYLRYIVIHVVRHREMVTE